MVPEYLMLGVITVWLFIIGGYNKTVYYSY